jgi:DNA-directed RNA polymerase specialized sigma24 family protein
MPRLGWIAMSEVTRILSQIDAGDLAAAEQLLPLVYDELRKLAAAKLAHEKPGQTLQATALVHEAYLRLVASGRRQPPEATRVGGQEPGVGEPPTPDPRSPTPGYNSHGHFFAAAAEAMRRILIDRARAIGSVKRGGNRQRLELPDVPAADEELRVDDLLDLDAALRKLAAVDPVAARLVELRVFAGQSVDESAAILNLSPSTAKRPWNYARAWLRREVGAEHDSRPNS